MARPPTRVERFVLQTLNGIGRIGLGRLLTRFYLHSLVAGAKFGMPMVFRGYEPADHDVFVCTMAKSGTNWMMQIVSQIADHGAAEFEDIHALVPWPEAPVPSQVARLDDPVRSRSGLRAVKTHVPAEHVPYSEKARYVVVVRDPKDMFVSSFHFVSGLIEGIWGAPPSLEDWYRRFVEERFPLGSWAEHTAGWWALRERDNVLFLTFKELKEDLPTQVDRVAQLMGVTLDEAARERVIERSRFGWMKQHQDRFATPVPAVRGERALMIRKGLRGKAGELLSPEQCSEIDRVCQAGLRERGCELDWDRSFGPPPGSHNRT